MLAGLIYTLIAIFSFLLVLSFLVFFHELGHYSVARFFNIAVEKFSIGFGKPIWSRRRKNGEVWSISRIPLGGYVKFAGDAGAASNPDTEKLEAMKLEFAQNPDGLQLDDIFHFRPVWQRALVVLAGPVANFILAAIIFAGLGLAVGKLSSDSRVTQVNPDTAAAEAGFQVGDQILTMDRKDASDFSFVQQYVMLRSDTPIQTVVLRDGEKVNLTVTPRRIETRDFVGGKAEIGSIGLIAMSERETLNVPGALGYGVSQVGQTISATGTYLGRIFQGKENGKQLGSVVKIGTVVGKVAHDTAKADAPVADRLKAWAIRMAALAASISIALGVANLMPLPVLDGGHLLYYSYEAVAGRPLSQQKQEFGFRIGFAVLLTLFVILTINDIGYVGSIIS